MSLRFFKFLLLEFYVTSWNLNVVVGFLYPQAHKVYEMNLGQLNFRGKSKGVKEGMTNYLNQWMA